MATTGGAGLSSPVAAIGGGTDPAAVSTVVASTPPTLADLFAFVHLGPTVAPPPPSLPEVEVVSMFPGRGYGEDVKIAASWSEWLPSL
ncbi:hypothetical protein E2562_033562 [Oryza meyeriana var. granulata]|uniref:Uncharacterized protein n=1 Tax=Oryza meyeriana var. granulata TaxID=110450 RepID=A0A6G1CUQ5_9ORYZ|nr:hypothetical protein E2562_033562 [Oryza meyeriana var. granulata]